MIYDYKAIDLCNPYSENTQISYHFESYCENIEHR